MGFSSGNGLRIRHTLFNAAGPSNNPMDTHTRTMFGAGTMNNCHVIPPDPSASITRSRSRGTLIFTHALAFRRVGPGRSGVDVPTAGSGLSGGAISG